MVNVVKVGGAILEKPDYLKEFLHSFSALKGFKILVHGGGRLATDLAQTMGVETKMIEGRRVTDDEMLEIVTMVYGGLANKSIVAKLQGLGINALGLCGADANLILSHKRPVEPINYGWVGDVDEVNAQLLFTLLQNGIIPIIAPLTHDQKGNLLNTNADTIAAEVAKAMAKIAPTQLILGFELEGVMLDPKNPNSLIHSITEQEFVKYKSDGIIVDGMIPKLTNAFSAIRSGVKSVKICAALKIAEAANNAQIGTLITA